MISEACAYLTLLLLVVLGGVVSYLTKQHPLDEGRSVYFMALSMTRTVIVSIFSACIVYLSCGALIEDFDKKLALAGFASFAGADLLKALQGGFITWLTRKLLGEKNDEK